MAVTLEILKKTVGKKKTPSRAYAWLADMERASGDLEGALHRVDGGLGFYMNDLPGLLVRSRILFEKGEYEDCVAVCEMALKNDPFCLSAQKRMGEAYEKLGNEAERNKCFRRVHDMDPLDNFWKEEYDVVLATAVAVDDSDFVMPGLSNDESEISADDGGFSFLTSSSDASSLVKENTFNTDESSSGDSSLFEKSLDSGAESVSSVFSKSTTDNENSSPFSLDTKSSLGDINTIEPNIEDEKPIASTEDDPFAALSALLPSDEDADSSAMDSLQASLDAAMSNLDTVDNALPEEFPSDENISGGDVSNVLMDMFGDDSFEDSTESKSPFSNLNIPKDVAPDSFNAKDVQSEDISLTNDSNLFGLMEKIDTADKQTESTEDKPMSVDSAFASIFGEDELPEEITPVTEVEPITKPASTEDKPMSVDSAFASIFGEDELPEENADENHPVENSLEGLDSALDSDDFSLNEGVNTQSLKGSSIEESSLSIDETPEKKIEGETSSELIDNSSSNESINLDSAFDSIFGSDELPEENSNSEKNSFVEQNTDKFAENISNNDFGSSIKEQTETAKDGIQSVESALASIFGEDEFSDEKNEVENVSDFFNENPETPVVEPISDSPDASSIEMPKPSLAEQVEKAENALDLPQNLSNGTDDIGVEESTSAAVEESVIPSNVDSSIESEVNGAFKDLFHTDDDDVPESEVPSNKGVDFLMSGDSDDEVSVSLIKDPSLPLAKGSAEIDESLNTRTLAEIYYEQGLYGKAFDIYQDLCLKEPNNAEYQERLEEIGKKYRDKFGDDLNG